MTIRSHPFDGVPPRGRPRHGGPAPRPLGPLLARIVMTMATMLLTPAAGAEERYADSAAAVDQAYDRAAQHVGASAGGDDKAQLDKLDALRRKLRELAPTLDDRAGALESARGRDLFLRHEMESAARDAKRIESAYQAEKQPFLDEIESMGAAAKIHNAADHQWTEAETAALAAYNAEAEAFNAKLAEEDKRFKEFEERYRQPRQDAKDRVAKKVAEYLESHEKVAGLGEKQSADADAFTALLGEARSAAQGLGATVNPGSSASAGRAARPATDDAAMDELRSAAGHGRLAAAQQTSPEQARKQAGKVFDEPGDKGMMVTPDPVAAPAGSSQDPVVPPERRTPASDRLELGLREARQEQAAAERRIAELKQQPQTPERDLKIVEAKIAESKAGNKANMKKFEIRELLDKAPPVQPDQPNGSTDR